jgi:hypothetical protein
MDSGWTIDIDAAGDAAAEADGYDVALLAFEQALEPFSGAVAGSALRDRYGARFSLDTESITPVEVLELGLDVFHEAAITAGLPPWQVVRCELLTYAEDAVEEEDDDEEYVLGDDD